MATSKITPQIKTVSGTVVIDGSGWMQLPLLKSDGTPIVVIDSGGYATYTIGKTGEFAYWIAYSPTKRSETRAVTVYYL